MTEEKEAGESLSEQIGREINEGMIMSGKSIDERILHLRKAEELLLQLDKSGSLLDNFLDEMLQFMAEHKVEIRSFVCGFIEKAVKKDPEVMKKAIVSLNWVLADSSSGPVVQKKVINVCTQLYPVVLKWVASRKTDTETENCWNAFSVLKNRIMQSIEADNEGEQVKNPYQMCLNDIGRDHRYISYRQMETEAVHCFNNLMDQMASTHISSLNLVTVIGCACNIARQRPDDHMVQVIAGIENLQYNLPPTLANSQVKSVRKELKMHLLRLLKHPFNHNIDRQKQITKLLEDLGATANEINKARPAAADLNEALRRRVAQQQQASQAAAALRRPLERSNLPEPKRMRLDEDEYEDEKQDRNLKTSLDETDSAATATQKAIDMTAEFITERLNINVVTNLVFISLLTLPDEMPPAFQASYTPISDAGTDEQIKHLARIMAIQFTKDGIGPGFEMVRDEKKKLFMERQAARMEGAVIPPTPYFDRGDISSKMSFKEPAYAKPQLPVKANKARLQQFNLITNTKELLIPEAQKLIYSTFQRIMTNEKRAVQGGASLAQQKLLVRLVTRFHSKLTTDFDEMLLNYIVEDQKNRTDLALLWLTELYAQFKSYTTCIPMNHLLFSDVERYVRYDNALTNLLGFLFSRGEHKETMFHKILLEVPFLTPASMIWLKKACMDETYGSFGMLTLRELIMTRTRQRHDLLKILLEFSYYERQDVKNQSVETTKELYQIDYLRDDVRTFVVEMSENLVKPTAPRIIWGTTGRIDEVQAAEIDEMPWDESLIRAALHLFLSLLPFDNSLLLQLASVYARAKQDIKRVVLRNVETAIKSINMFSDDLLKMVENCPRGAETLVARIVHLLTERKAPSIQLVEHLKNLHVSRNTDVRSLIPVLAGLSKLELQELIPKFVFSATNLRSVPIFFKKLISDRHIETQALLMGPVELLVELHKVKPANFKEKSFLIENLNLLIIDKEQEFKLTKDMFAQAIEQLIEIEPFSQTLFYTLQKLHEHYPVLNGFIANVLVKVAQKRVWEQNQKEVWPLFLKCAKEIGNFAYNAALTHLTISEFKEYYEQVNIPNFAIVLRSYLSTLSAHQQSQVNKEIAEFIKEEAKKIDGGAGFEEKENRISIKAQ